MNPVVLSALLPVIALIAGGWLLGRLGWIGPRWLKRLSELSFWVLTPVVLFRSMSRVHPEQLDLRPALAYTAALAVVFAGVLAWRGLNRGAVVWALGCTYSNALMIGLPLVQLAWGEPGLVVLLTLIPIHSLVLLTTATGVLEVALAREEAPGASPAAGRLLRVTWRALRRAFLHPVPLPILGGLLFAQTGWVLPVALDQTLRAVGMVFGPLALTLVGVALAGSSVGPQLRAALQLGLVKNFAVPTIAAVLGWALGMRGIALAVMVATAALPTGANVFIFSQRYGVAQAVITAGVAVSTLMALLSVSLVMLLAGRQ